MARDITLAEVKAAEAALVETKTAFRAQVAEAPTRRAAATQRRAYKDAAEQLVAVRSAYRLQETAAGRRRGFVGGDAYVTGIDCDVCGQTLLPADLDRHIMVEHMSKKG